MAKRDYYEVLGVEKSASPDQIKAADRKEHCESLKKWHMLENFANTRLKWGNLVQCFCPYFLISSVSKLRLTSIFIFNPLNLKVLSD